VPREAKPGSVDLPRARAALAALDLAATTMKTDAARSRLAAHLDTLKEAPMAPRPPKPEAERKGTQTAIRLTQEDLDRCERLAAKMGEAAGVEVTRSAAMRAALAAGLEVLEVKLGLRAAAKRAARGGS
jgi:trimethylamine:corrinoid methyltransferase-like protein